MTTKTNGFYNLNCFEIKWAAELNCFLNYISSIKKSGFGLFLDFLLTILIFKLCAARTLKNSFLCSSEYFLENLAKKPFKC